MTSIVVSEEQTRIIKGSPQGVEIRSPNGEFLVILTHVWTEKDIQSALQVRASDEPVYTTAEVWRILNRSNLGNAIHRCMAT